ncbi:prepilin-type N-terminal cleavage/methylation domain-containing protein [Sporolactobacillus sp. THM7-4]|nr:prepilin-type N-terminal cleavage/methylation domain-containing protein [Sporolactobacillus sp. THM7-4]
MADDNRGVTLIELLAVTTLLAILSLLIFSVMLSGMKESRRNMMMNDLQADAHLVQSRLTEAFYNKNNQPFTVTTDQGRVKITYLKTGQSEVISDPGLIYTHDGSWPDPIGPGTNTLDLNLTIRSENESADRNISYQINTELDYPWKDSQGGSSNE